MFKCPRCRPSQAREVSGNAICRGSSLPKLGPHGSQLCCLGVLSTPIICCLVLVKYSLHPLPNSPSRRGPPLGLRSPAGCSCCQQSSVGTGQPPNPTEAVPLTLLCAEPLPAAPPSRPFLNADSRKFTLDLTYMSAKETVPLPHLNSAGCLHPHPGVLTSCWPRTALCPSGRTRLIPLYLQVVLGGRLSCF